MVTDYISGDNMNFLEDEIESIEFVGYEKTIDIEVSSTDHLFVANDILTHNSATQEQEHDHSMIAGGISKIQTADNVISIFASAAMKERGEYQIQFLKTRSSSGVGSKVFLGFDPNTLRIFDREDSGTSIIGSTSATDVFADLRRKNTVSKSANGVTGPNTTPNSAGNKSIKDLTTLTSLIRR